MGGDQVSSARQLASVAAPESVFGSWCQSVADQTGYAGLPAFRALREPYEKLYQAMQLSETNWLEDAPRQQQTVDCALSQHGCLSGVKPCCRGWLFGRSVLC